MVSAMLGGHPAKLPQRVFDPFGQRFKRFAETDRDRLGVGLGQYTVKEQMRKGLPSQGNRHVLHRREIRLRAFSRRMGLRNR